MALILLVYFGTMSQQLIDWMTKRTAAVKLGTAVLFLLLVYGLGRGVPIVLFGTFAGMIKLIPTLTRWTHRLEQVCGVLMIGVGLYYVWIA